MVSASTLRRDIAVACLFALVLGAGWAWSGRADLSALRLPDTDDVMRLQQVRDWLAGQRFADVAQHRMAGAPPLHWTRLADLGPAALIVALAPLLGTHGAEVAAVVVWPLVLFAVALALVARIARTLDAKLAGTACAVAAIGYPATTLFLPGRIDHHGLQMVLLLAAVLSLLRPPTPRRGAALGLLAAASLTIGLETAPLLGALGIIAITDWVLGRDGSGFRLAGLALGAPAGLLGAHAFFATSGWDYAACDGFTAQAWRAAVFLSITPVVLASLNARVTGARKRSVAVGVTCCAGGVLALWASPACLHPYGSVDPLLARLWLGQVQEAQPLFAAPTGAAIGYAGLMLAGLAASAWRLRVTRDHGWAILLVVQIVAAAITLAQLRGAYAGALLAAPGLAAVIGAARARGSLPVIGAWLGSAGMLYPIAAQALTPRAVQRASARGDCASPALLAALDRLPSGVVIAPVDAGAAILGHTRQKVIAAPYHRAGPGILAAFRFYRGAPAEATAVADRWRARYWIACADMPGAARAKGLTGWTRVSAQPDGAAIWARDVDPVAR